MSNGSDLPPDITSQVLLGEAVGEGPEGLAFVRDVFVNRARAKGQTLEQVVSAPKQFSAFGRPDLSDFAAQQPPMLQNLANILIEEARDPAFQPATTVQNFVTRDLWERRNEPGVPAWIKKMKAVAFVGNHVALAEK